MQFIKAPYFYPLPASATKVGRVLIVQTNGKLEYASPITFYDDMMDTLRDAGSTELTWLRDNVKGAVYLGALPDKVGIGTNSPTQALDVRGNMIVSSDSTDFEVKEDTLQYYSETGSRALLLSMRDRPNLNAATAEMTVGNGSEYAAIAMVAGGDYGTAALSGSTEATLSTAGSERVKLIPGGVVIKADSIQMTGAVEWSTHWESQVITDQELLSGITSYYYAISDYPLFAYSVDSAATAWPINDTSGVFSSLTGRFYLPMSYEPGGDVYFFVNYFGGGSTADTARFWKIQYNWYNECDARLSTKSTIYSDDETVCGTTVGKNKQASFLAIDGTGKAPGSFIEFRLWARVTTGRIVYFQNIGIKYPTNRPGKYGTTP
jgi:hypothetical protein